MTEYVVLPPPEKLTDSEIYSLLRHAGTKDERAIGELFIPPTIALAARIERLVTDNPEIIQRAATKEPVFDLPYFPYPPDIELPLPMTQEDAVPYLENYHSNRDLNLFAEQHFPWLESAINERLGTTVDMGHWQQYREHIWL